MPVLAKHSFSNLRSLSLAWGGGHPGGTAFTHHVHIPKDALMIIRELVSLEQLSLCAGSTDGGQPQWLVDHAELLACLSKLQRLKKLALVRDTYPIPEDGHIFKIDDRVMEYYSAYVVTQAEVRDAYTRPELDLEEDAALDEFGYDDEHNMRVREWTRAHRNRMLIRAEEYAAALPVLEWMYCGQRPMGFEKDPKSPSRKAVALSENKDGCITYLASTFGSGTYQA
ncbi:hypothetical protein ACHAPT_010942 [Fusarium lateritium]